MMGSDTILYMLNLSKSWTDETIALLLNKKLIRAPASAPSCHGDGDGDNNFVKNNSIRIHRLPLLSDDGNGGCDNNGNGIVAQLEFSSREERNAVYQSYQGIAVPMTHGYHYFTFSVSPTNKKNEGDNECQQHSWMLGKPPSPPLHLQLLALPTRELECRVRQQQKQASSLPLPPKHGKVHRHASFANRLGTLLGGRRPAHSVLGVAIDPQYTAPLLRYLQQMQFSSLWPPTSKHRKGVASGHYLTVRQSHPPEYDDLWNLCKDVIGSLPRGGESHNKINSDDDDHDIHYTALAVTYNFRGSPHRDVKDTSYQHVIALGNFHKEDDCGGGGGGHLCVDTGPTVTQLVVHNRLGRLDGRHVHWVSGWDDERGNDEGTDETSERYSVVYYTTKAEHYTSPDIPQSVHNRWMADMIERIKGRTNQSKT